MKNRVLLFSRDPGGANTVIPLIKTLKDRNYEVLLYGKDVSLQRYKLYGFNDAQDILEHVDSIDVTSLKQLLESLKPDFIITGTSINDMSERYIWKAAESLKIDSFAILDQWVNYGIRFSNYTVSDSIKFDKTRDIVYLPTKILVMDQLAKEEAVQDGLPYDRILITGQPYFDFIINSKKELLQKKESIAKKLKIDIQKEYVILFASEPIIKAFKDRNSNPFGYNEKEIFDILLEKITYLENKINKNLTFIIKLHPTKNDIDSFQEYKSQVFSGNKRIIIDEDTNQWELLTVSDLVVGMSSMLLLEASIFEKHVLSIQIGLKRDDPFILSRKGFLETILNKDILLENLIDIIIHNKSQKVNFNFAKDAVTNVIKSMESYLCQN